MVAETINEPDPTAPKRTFRFLLLSRRADRSLGRLSKATRALEAEAVDHRNPDDAAAIQTQFTRARRERDASALVSLVRQFAGPVPKFS